MKKKICSYLDSVVCGVCVVVMVAIFSAFVSSEALEDSGKRIRKKCSEVLLDFLLKILCLKLPACSNLTQRV